MLADKPINFIHGVGKQLADAQGRAVFTGVEPGNYIVSAKTTNRKANGRAT